MKQRFISDGMLGSLSRWLRISGYDTEYRKDAKDNDLIEEAKREDRTLLTRDETLVRRARKLAVKALYIYGKDDESALSQLSSELGLKYDPTQARCPKCNNAIKKIGKAEVVDKTPVRTYNIIKEYWLCDHCGSIYWRGSHWPRIVDTLIEAERCSGDSSSRL